MKITKQIIGIVPLGLLLAGCGGLKTQQSSAPYDNPTVAQWQSEGELLPPTGGRGASVYSAPETPKKATANIVVESNRGDSSDVALAETLRQKLEFDRGLMPSLRNVTIAVCDGAVTLRGTVKSDLDKRVIVQNIDEIPGITQIKNEMQVSD